MGVQISPYPPIEMKPHKWKTIRRRIKNATEESERGSEISTFQEVIKIMNTVAQTQLSSSESRKEIDSGHNTSYNK